jgi:hypothetical protein
VLVAEARRLEGLDEVDVEVPRRLGRRPVVGRAEEQVADALDAALLPLDLVLPDLEAGDVGGLVGPLHELADGAEVGAVQGIVGEASARVSIWAS